MRKRTIKKQLWLDANENKLLKQKATKAGLTESEFLRSCIKGYKIKEQPTEEIKDMHRKLAGVANNINQITHNSYLFQYIRGQDLEYIKQSIKDFIIEFEKRIYSRQRLK